MRSEIFNENTLSDSEEDLIDDVISESLSDVVVYLFYGCVAMLLIVFSVTTLRMLILGQKTRNPQQRRQYLGSRTRTSLPQPDPTVYVSPANLPPPPKYEAMAPPSYEEVVGIHYPNYQPPMQPIAQPIATAMAQNASANVDTEAATNRNNDNQSNTQTTLTVTNERTTTAAVAVSS
ncbi:PREDICTED: uncharacterized protein LOC106116439 isoform X2 [Papilio xuthus]|uniref:Uncharacterized protein LOC106116439 isoform X2 n=1 Tax=Papilio xuthus TaxID=66420 RepID=A0AAJ6Z5L6_PAPXU|nr:PREDICTED: uncharacterized protein LOC106116439 isoform X2 [Papilio xuthus]